MEKVLNQENVIGEHKEAVVIANTKSPMRNIYSNPNIVKCLLFNSTPDLSQCGISSNEPKNEVRDRLRLKLQTQKMLQEQKDERVKQKHKSRQINQKQKEDSMNEEGNKIVYPVAYQDE